MSVKEENESPEKEYIVLPEDYACYDISFKIVVIGNSGNK